MKFYKLIISSLLIISSIGFLSGCASINPYTGERQLSDTSIGTGIGAIGGAIAGQLIGGNAAGTLIGAGFGSVIGGVIGHTMDNQNEQLRARLRGTGVQIARNGKDIRLIILVI